ncbi:MAG: DUF4238 domain-containing protein [Comamonas sp.]
MKKKERQKKQHYVPKCYLKSWIDPAIPRHVNGQNIWVFDRDGENPKQQSPRSTFTEEEMYTLTASNGERDLRLEHGLGTIESQFGAIRTNKFNFRRPLSHEEWGWVCLFAATLHLRTVTTRDHMLGAFKQLKKMVEDVAPPEWWDENEIPDKPRDKNVYYPRPGDFDNMKEDVTQTLLQTAAKHVAPRLASMHATVLCTEHPIGFVTTDAPSTWFDPGAYRLPPLQRSVGLNNIDIQITLPLSPKQCLVFSHRDIWDSPYVDVSDDVVDAINHRNISYAPNSIVAAKNDLEPTWLKRSPPPPDSWEALHPGEEDVVV